MKRILVNSLNCVVIIVLAVVLFFDTVGKVILDWYCLTFGVTIEEILYTIKSPLKGADINFIYDVVDDIIPVLFLYVFMLSAIFLCVKVCKFVSIDILVYKVRIHIISWLVLIIMALSLRYSFTVFREADEVLKISKYIENRLKETHIYEKYYVKPDIDMIRADSPRNIIYIYLESMETTYASIDDGGYQLENNYIPMLTELARQNISFSNDDKLGGFRCTRGTGWTTVAMFASQTGIPYAFPIEDNEDIGNREAFATGTITMGDILKEKGYYQEFLCGSDADFGGRRAFYEQHGGYNIYDVNTAIKNGYIAEDEKVWWGLEDKTLYGIAKDELARMAELNQPFNLTMLTVDTHHVGGWTCSLCGNEYTDQLANVVKCADRQVSNFVSWCSEQEWFEDTVIVIQGDHPRMDQSLVQGINYNDRTIYNCFINSSIVCDEQNLYNREFTPMDMFPSILAAMGFCVPEDHLGLGTNLFSERRTLSEELGYLELNDELSKYSKWYIDNFS